MYLLSRTAKIDPKDGVSHPNFQWRFCLRQNAFQKNAIPSKCFTAKYFSCFLTHFLAFPWIFKKSEDLKWYLLSCHFSQKCPQNYVVKMWFNYRGSTTCVVSTSKNSTSMNFSGIHRYKIHAKGQLKPKKRLASHRFSQKMNGRNWFVCREE